MTAREWAEFLDDNHPIPGFTAWKASGVNLEDGVYCNSEESHDRNSISIYGYLPEPEQCEKNGNLCDMVTLWGVEDRHGPLVDEFETLKDALDHAKERFPEFFTEGEE